MSQNETAADLQDDLRQRICDLLSRTPFIGKLRNVEKSEALVRSAFAFRDFNGGAGDTYHAAKCLHELVDQIASERNPNYTLAGLEKYKATGRT